ncbi:hypothetical protein H0S70_06945 [Chryseobacterium manosquense]|uniref:Uncharacterized protein n=1 Tax=Chryseobacterium manosquense TaxID=2754694 RepID=A0A7H1DT36_9FLAO|nr:hypothetical protein [Chryseobacterium manosquense]QNS40144.1 hypothetical protein H0S70_06945 [Chryseobacterium manosquense]
MKNYKEIFTECNSSLTCGISSAIIDHDSDNPKRMSDNVSLVIEGYDGEEETSSVVILSKENTINLAITLLKYAQKLNIVISDVECVTSAVKGDDLYTEKNIPIREIFKLYQL